MDIQQVKDDVASSLGYRDSEHVFVSHIEEFITDKEFDDYFDRCMLEYARQKCIDQKYICKDDIPANHIYPEYRVDVWNLIVNAPLATDINK